MQDVSKVVKLMKQAKGYEEEGENFIKMSKEKISEARELCPHAVTVSKDDYYEGGYMNKATTTTNTYCEICGKLLETNVTTHSWYG